MAEELAAAIGDLLGRVPSDVVRHLAREVATWRQEPWGLRRLRALRAVALPQFQPPVERLLEVWERTCPGASAEGVALALLAADAAVRSGGEDREETELIWTGPDVGAVPMRRTDQALLEVIRAARHTLLIVSFAVYRIPAVREAVREALLRGVEVRICVEGDEAGVALSGYDVVDALGEEIRERAEVYIWPDEHRPRAAGGRTGVLHAKCAVADRTHLFVSSANLTEHALSINLELGVLVQGGPLPGKVADQFGRLIDAGVLRRV
jgi:phosphatidylserine/phosphatidylglycerophosphate/cardiolipin synthase-like enzyme